MNLRKKYIDAFDDAQALANKTRQAAVIIQLPSGFYAGVSQAAADSPPLDQAAVAATVWPEKVIVP